MRKGDEICIICLNSSYVGGSDVGVYNNLTYHGNNNHDL